MQKSGSVEMRIQDVKTSGKEGDRASKLSNTACSEKPASKRSRAVKEKSSKTGLKLSGRLSRKGVGRRDHSKKIPRMRGAGGSSKKVGVLLKAISNEGKGEDVRRAGGRK